MLVFTDIILTLICGYIMYRVGKSSARRELINSSIKSVLDSAIIPIVVAEEIEGHYYVYEKDTTNFLCQAEKLEDIPINLYSNKKISLALILFPEEAHDRKFWCINGKIKLAE
jgi:hypothetical protein